VSPLVADRELPAPANANKKSRPLERGHAFGNVVQQASETRRVATIIRVVARATTLGHRHAIADGGQLESGPIVPARMTLDAVQNHNLCNMRLGRKTFPAKTEAVTKSGYVQAVAVRRLRRYERPRLLSQAAPPSKR